MKNLCYLLLLASIYLLTSCSSDENEHVMNNSDNILDLQLTKINSSDNNTYTLSSNEILEKETYYGTNDFIDGVVISKSITMNILLPTDEELDFKLTFHKSPEDESLLELGNSSTGEWDYFESDDDMTFYTEQVNWISLRNDNMSEYNGGMIHADSGTEIEFINIEEVTTVHIDGVEKTKVKLTFSGVCKSWYDAENIYLGYDINGTFNGIIED